MHSNVFISFLLLMHLCVTSHELYGPRREIERLPGRIPKDSVGSSDGRNVDFTAAVGLSDTRQEAGTGSGVFTLSPSHPLTRSHSASTANAQGDKLQSFLNDTFHIFNKQ